MTRHLPLAFLCVACRSVLPDGTDDIRTVDTDEDTDGTDWPGFVPESFGLTDAVFAVDGSGRAVSWSDPGGAPVPIRITFTIADEDAPPEFALEHSCTVTFEHPGPIAEAAWAAPLTAYTAFELPDDATATSDCSRHDFPPWWTDTSEALLRRWTWGFGLGPLHADAKAALGADWDALKDLAAGGGYYWDGLVEIENLPLEKWQDGWVNTSVVFAYETNVNGERVLVGGAPVPLDKATVPSGPGVRPAQYGAQAITLLTPASLLLTDLTP